jgi:hypothetical protein
MHSFSSCSNDDDTAELTVNPAIEFRMEEYKVKIGKEVDLRARVENAVNPIYSWKRDGKIISSDTICLFKGESLGEYFLNFRVDADNGNLEKQVKVSVVDRLPPQIQLGVAEVAYSGLPKEIAAVTHYTDETTTFEWSYGGKVVGHDSIYIFKETGVNIYTLALKVTNEDGIDVKGSQQQQNMICFVQIGLDRILKFKS